VLVVIELRRRRITGKITSKSLMVLFICLFLACNKHSSMPAARCLMESDCINGEACVDGFCRFTHVLEVEVRFVNMYSRVFKEKLIINVIRCRESFNIFDCSGKNFSYAKKAPKYPFRLRFNKMPGGKYLVVAAIDVDGSGKINQHDIAGMSLVKTVDSSSIEARKNWGVVNMQYSYAMISANIEALKQKSTFWDIN
jgi:hypothetical protein